MRVNTALLIAALLTGCASSHQGVTPIEDIRPAALMQQAWAAGYERGAQPEWEPRIDGDCSNKVAWAMERCSCGQAIIGYRNWGVGSVYHAALLVDGIVYDWDGSWPVDEYPMLVESVR